MKKSLVIVLCLAMLALGAAIGYALKPQSEPVKPVVKPKVVKHEPAKVKPGSDAETVALLRDRVKRLEAKLAAQAKKNAAKEKPAAEDPMAAIAKALGGDGSSVVVSKTIVSTNGLDGIQGQIEAQIQEQLGKMGLDSKEVMAQVREQLEGMRKRNDAKFASSREFLGSIDVSRLGPKAVKTHNELQKLLESRDACEKIIRNPQASAKEKEDAMTELALSEKQLQKLNGEERDNLLAMTAEELGCKGEDAKVVTRTIKDIFRATSNKAMDATSVITLGL